MKHKGLYNPAEIGVYLKETLGPSQNVGLLLLKPLL